MRWIPVDPSDSSKISHPEVGPKMPNGPGNPDEVIHLKVLHTEIKGVPYNPSNP